MAHDKEDALWVLLLVVLLWDDDIEEFDSDDIVLHGRQSAENCDFSVNSLNAVDVFKCIGDVLDGHSFIFTLLSSFDDLAEATLSLDLEEFVVLGDGLPDGWQAFHEAS